MYLLKRFISFQHDRFPLRILVFTTLSSILASAAVSGNKANITDYFAAFFVCLFLVFHIRVIDESRDCIHDSIYYPDRPINTGKISLKELFLIDLVGMFISLTIVLIYGQTSTLWFMAIILFTTFAWKDFFMAKLLFDKPLLYHIINSPQMVLIQLLIYSILSHSDKISQIMWIQLLLLYINIFILEVVRKIKLKTEETTAQDTYSKSMGYCKSLLFTLILAIGAYVIFYWLITNISNKPIVFLIIGTVIAVFSVESIISHIYIKTKASEKYLLLSVLMVYIGFNVILYLSVL
jgi:hypothetical protein